MDLKVGQTKQKMRRTVPFPETVPDTKLQIITVVSKLPNNLK